MATELRNWIERAIGKQIVWRPTHVGKKSGRDKYCVQFYDGTEKDYFIDFEHQTVEEVIY